MPRQRLRLWNLYQSKDTSVEVSRGRFLATSVFNLKGTRDNDTPLVKRTQAALT